ncbi:MAG: class aminotransferase [Acidimicrobiales bacterium]|nr:class aminotransferase [Acidimicrobiales bacterium]
MPLPSPPPASAPPPAPLPDVRAWFDLPADVAYLNCAFMGPMPKVAVEAGWSGMGRKMRPWTITPDDFTVPVDQLRGRIADLLGAPDDADGVAITPSVSYGVATAAHNLTMGPGQVAVVLHQQFPSDVYGWEALARRHGGDLHVVAPPADGDWTAAVLADLALLGDRVGLVSVPPCHWIDGARIDLVAVGAAARAVGAALSVDVCQSLGAQPFDVAAVQPDFVVGATYKWLLGPYSLGFLWAAPDRRAGEPIEHGWTGRANSHCLACLAEYTDEFQPGARRYDVGEVANFALVPAALAAVSMIAAWGPASVAAHAATITGRVADGATALGLTVAPAHLRSPHLMGLRLGPGADAEALAPALADRGVHVSVRGDAVRVSAHAFNTLDDADRLLAALAEVLR